MATYMTVCRFYEILAHFFCCEKVQVAFLPFCLLKKVGIFIAASTTPGPTRIGLWPNPGPGAKGPEG